MAGNTLQAMQIGLHVVGNNIANANTPGYIRERTVFTPAPVLNLGSLTLGLGVEVAGIVQQVDNFVETRLRDAGSDRASADIQEKAFRDLQAIIGELTDTDISTSLSSFFNTIGEITLTPNEIAIRNLAIQQGGQLTSSINNLDRRVRALHQDFSSRVENIASEINTLTEQIRQLNLKIVTSEAGGSSASEAGGLRSQRGEALQQLSEIIDITVTERETGTVNVSVGGELLVFEGTSRNVESQLESNDGVITTRIVFTDNDAPLDTGGGELHGIYEARDTVLSGFLTSLDNFAATLAFEFNKVYSQGRGIDGFTELTSVNGVDDAGAPLDAAGLDFTPTDGEFTLLVRNIDTGTTEPTLISVDLDGLDGDSTLASLAAAIDAVDGVTATVSPANELTISSESTDIDFSFAGDSSGVLAALGINTFFAGSSARDLGVNGVLLGDSSGGAKFAASLLEDGAGADNALNLIRLNDEALGSVDGGTISDVYDQIINETTQGATIAAAVADGLRVFEGTLDASAQAVSGVNLDEEAIDMIMLQRTYQASARYISTVSELLDVLVNL